MRARHLPLVLLGAAVVAACGPAPARGPSTGARRPVHIGIAAHAAARPTVRPPADPPPAASATAHAPAGVHSPAPVVAAPAPVTPSPPAVAAAYRSACAGAGGLIADTMGALWAPGTCVVSYPGEGTFPVTIDPGGAFDWAWAQRNQTDCGLLAYYAQLDAAAHHRWRQPPLYYPQTGVCFSGQPG